MHRVLLPLLALLVLASIALPNAAHAYLITVNFAVQGSTLDPTHGSDTASGSFQFDSSLIPATLPGTLSDLSNGLNITSFDLTWAGHTYSTSDALITAMNFNAAGQLIYFEGGATANGGVYTLTGNSNDVFVSSTAFRYAYPGDSHIYSGSVTSWSVDYGTAPEPGSLALVAPALLAFGLIRRRRS